MIHAADREAPPSHGRRRASASVTICAVVLLAGCSSSPGPIARNASGDQQRLDSGVGSSGSPGPRSTLSAGLTPHAASASASATEVTASAAAVPCESIVFEAAAANAASQIRAYRLSCDQAETLVRKISASHSFLYGPKIFARFGFSCTATVSAGATPVADYDCRHAGGGRVRWRKS